MVRIRPAWGIFRGEKAYGLGRRTTDGSHAVGGIVGQKGWTQLVGQVVLDMSKQSAEYWREKKREQREKAKTQSGEAADPLAERLPWPLNEGKAARWGEGVPNYIPLTLDEKAAMEEDIAAEIEAPQKPAEASQAEWEMCLVRAERARAYAEGMPGQVKPSEEEYQDPLWQWENEVRK